jgi:hypothetical protein
MVLLTRLLNRREKMGIDPKSLISTYFVLNGLFNGERGVEAKTCGVGHQQDDGWYWLVDDTDDGRGPYPSKEDAFDVALADPVVKDLLVQRNLYYTVNKLSGFRHKPGDWDEVGGVVPTDVLNQLELLNANELGVSGHIGAPIAVTLPPAFLLKRGGGLYLVRDSHNYIRSIRYVGPASLREEAPRVLKPDEQFVLGHLFRPMTQDDWDCFAGADEGSKICYTEEATMILNPDGSVSEIRSTGDGIQSTQIDWKPEEI